MLALVCGCTGQRGADTPTPTAPADAPPMRLVAYTDCSQLLSGLRTTAEKQVGPYGLPNGMAVRADLGGRALPGAESAQGTDAAPVAPGAVAKQAPDHSSTNAHEAGVDEPDLVKTDGRRIVAIARGELHVVDPAARKVTGTLSLPTVNAPWATGDLLLAGDRAMIILPEQRFAVDEGVQGVRPDPSVSGPRLRLLLVDLAGKPRVLSTLTADGDYLDARQTGSTARVVLRSAPRIQFPPWRQGRSDTAATAENRRIVRRAPLEAWLPRYEVTTGANRQSLRVPCERVSRPSGSEGTSVLSVLTVNLGGDAITDADPVSVVTNGRTVYGTGSSLYISESDYGNTGPLLKSVKPAKPQKARTDIHRFDVTGAGRPRYAASGSVPGTLLNQYSMSEYDGRLRVATTHEPADSGSGGSSTVHVLAQKGPRLDVVGSVGGLGKGERIYSVRFIGPTGYVVTFRQVDPLYTIDLRDPARPKVTGELKITGYSAYLHPAGDGRLLGVGQEASAEGRTQGLQVSLFDVTRQPKRLARFHLPNVGAEAEYDPHAFLFWPQTGLTVVPITAPDGKGEALALRVTADGIRGLGTVEHPRSQIRRSLVIGDTLWTMSDAGLRGNALSDLKERAWVRF
ncbi:beta-propeller domain-containing protein [Actinomadura sp. HBU206391]|uniref:beta-propeller domain-containing protein n=1 Tax=Actinomadura sp. HBU206391 TaxID=2731692 RepID=UPI00164F039F|nr:beta-propeller domain-containing protein [Actinomadura sp. HBU206391]MBC6462944.1 beta-propeller domain-containing protein [Actinomadura sp. HBU206391]